MGYKRILMLMMLPCLWAGSLMAEEEYNPKDPPDPSPTYSVKVAASPSNYGYVSGTGRYREGEGVELRTSARDIDYIFRYWLKDGEQYSTDSYIYYTVEKKDVVFTAVYEYLPFDPVSPDDPAAINRTYRLSLECYPEDAGSFSINSGQRFEAGQWINLEVYPNHGFDFVGWYEDSSMLSKSKNFNYETNNVNTTLKAVFNYNPTSPSDPGTSTSTGKRGDVNNDDQVNSTDASIVVKKFLDGVNDTGVYDLNNDGVVNITDASTILNIYLNGN